MPHVREANTVQLLQKYLELTGQRQSVIVDNIANVDTPNYKTKDLDFKSALDSAIDNTGPGVPARVSEVRDLLQRPDGNNVNLEREGLQLSETQMQYRIGVQLVRSEFHRWLAAINEGK